MLQIQARPVPLPPPDLHLQLQQPLQPEPRRTRPVRERLRIYDRSIILLFERLIYDFRSFLGPSHLDECAEELVEDIQSWTMTRASKNVEGENADEHRRLLLLELEQLVMRFSNLGKAGGRRGGDKGKGRAVRG